MTCEAIRDRLLDGATADFVELEPHLASCVSCSAAADLIRAAETEIVHELDTFIRAREPDWSLLPQRTPRRRWGFHGVVLAVATAAVLALAVLPLLPRDHPLSSVPFLFGLGEQEASDPDAIDITRLDVQGPSKAEEDAALRELWEGKHEAHDAAEETYREALATLESTSLLEAQLGIAEIRAELADELMNAVLPSYMTESQRRIYQMGLDDRAWILRRKAIAAYGMAASTAADLGLDDRADEILVLRGTLEASLEARRAENQARYVDEDFANFDAINVPAHAAIPPRPPPEGWESEDRPSRSPYSRVVSIVEHERSRQRSIVSSVAAFSAELGPEDKVALMSLTKGYADAIQERLEATIDEDSFESTRLWAVEQHYAKACTELLGEETFDALIDSLPNEVRWAFTDKNRPSPPQDSSPGRPSTWSGETREIQNNSELRSQRRHISSLAAFPVELGPEGDEALLALTRHYADARHDLFDEIVREDLTTDSTVERFAVLQRSYDEAYTELLGEETYDALLEYWDGVGLNTATGRAWQQTAKRNLASQRRLVSSLAAFSADLGQEDEQALLSLTQRYSEARFDLLNEVIDKELTRQSTVARFSVLQESYDEAYLELLGKETYDALLEYWDQLGIRR